MTLPAGIWIFTGGDGLLFIKKACPVNYDLLCRQTVTVYHKEGEEYIRKVYSQAFLDHKKTQTVDKVGSQEANSFLLVIPGNVQTVFVGDKVYDGTGPDIQTAEQWRNFVPTHTPGLVVVKYADCKKWDNVIVHTEAGG